MSKISNGLILAFDQVITGDETHCFDYDPETNHAMENIFAKTENCVIPYKNYAYLLF